MSTKRLSITMAVMVLVIYTTTSSTEAYPRLTLLHPKGGVDRVFSPARRVSTGLRNKITQSPIHYFKLPAKRTQFKKTTTKMSSWMSPIHFLNVPYVSNARPVRPYVLKKKPSKPLSTFNAISSIINSISKSGIFNLPLRFISNGRPYKVYKLQKRSTN